MGGSYFCRVRTAVSSTVGAGFNLGYFLTVQPLMVRVKSGPVYSLVNSTVITWSSQVFHIRSLERVVNGELARGR